MSEILKRIEYISIDKVVDPNFKTPEALKLRGIKAVKIYYCLYGRNAWNSTWVRKYSKDCMHTTLESARDFAESKRVQGSVFYIKELPALFFDGGLYPILITQINEPCPLKNYSANALTTNIAFGYQKIEGYRDNYLTFGSPLNGVLLSFKHTSRFWRIQPPEDSSVILLYSKHEYEPIELGSEELQAWKSQAMSKSAYLSWSYLKANVSQKAILELYDNYVFSQ